jgi:acyl-CoA oxidase
MDYQNTSAALLPLVATSYVMHAMGQALWAAYEEYEAQRSQGRFDTLPELHALSSGLKAVVTSATADGIEAARRCCGGHAYSALSGLPTLFASYVQNCTWEGDNNVMLLQTARYVLKNAAAIQSGKTAPAAVSLEYLSVPRRSNGGAAQPPPQDGAAAEAVLEWARTCFAARARYLVQQGFAALVNHPASGELLRSFQGNCL